MSQITSTGAAARVKKKRIKYETECQGNSRKSFEKLFLTDRIKAAVLPHSAGPYPPAEESVSNNRISLFRGQPLRPLLPLCPSCHASALAVPLLPWPFLY